MIFQFLFWILNISIWYYKITLIRICIINNHINNLIVRLYIFVIILIYSIFMYHSYQYKFKLKLHSLSTKWNAHSPYHNHISPISQICHLQITTNIVPTFDLRPHTNPDYSPSGSDISNIEMVAMHNEDNSTFTLDGSKHFVVNGNLADVYVVFARVPTINTLVYKLSHHLINSSMLLPCLTMFI